MVMRMLKRWLLNKVVVKCRRCGKEQVYDSTDAAESDGWTEIHESQRENGYLGHCENH